MQNYLDLVPCFYYASADDGTLLAVNDYLCSTLGYNEKDILGKKIDVLFTVSTRIFYQTHFYPLLKMQKYAEEIFITLQNSNGEALPVLINAQRRVVDGVEINLQIGIAVHQRQKFEEELIAAKKTAEAALNENTELIQAKLSLQKHAEELDRQIFIANKQNEELRQFSRIATHDMQEPLRKLSLFSGMVLENGEPSDQHKLVSKIKKVSDQMRSILNGLQQYVWLSETDLNIENIDLAKLLNNVQDKLAEEFPNVDLIIKKEGLNFFWADHDQMQLLFYELLSNAIQFRKEKQEVCVDILAEELQVNQFRHIEGKYKYANYTRIQIRDYGKGFNSEYKAQVFELFKKLHPESRNGVGLSLCKKIAENHHGTISIDSKIDEGTTVMVHLPNDPVKTNVSFEEITSILKEHQ